MFLQVFTISVFNLILIKEKTKPVNSIILGTCDFVEVLHVLPVQVWLCVWSVQQPLWVTLSPLRDVHESSVSCSWASPPSASTTGFIWLLFFSIT